MWLVISNPRLALPHVTRNVAQNTRPSLHMQEGLGTRLVPSMLNVVAGGRGVEHAGRG